MAHKFNTYNHRTVLEICDNRLKKGENPHRYCGYKKRELESSISEAYMVSVYLPRLQTLLLNCEGRNLFTNKSDSWGNNKIASIY